MYTFEEQRKKPIENVIEIRTMCREQEICKNGGFNLKWFCFLDKLERGHLLEVMIAVCS